MEAAEQCDIPAPRLSTDYLRQWTCRGIMVNALIAMLCPILNFLNSIKHFLHETSACKQKHCKKHCNSFVKPQQLYSPEPMSYRNSADRFCMKLVVEIKIVEACQKHCNSFRNLQCCGFPQLVVCGKCSTEFRRFKMPTRQALQ